ncbi:heterodimeric geranylgeranyl pyrophosphate synthase small subunit 2, chloroplastic-like [Bidens hawaiensis]|uniref:heterodimeric geranylgeranyl pyrophosphate synthase small subunit 2, chloroplastic-like n=1 Tax=Bidens hawaiensis TaxID=980011 RepID=UPI0040499154
MAGIHLPLFQTNLTRPSTTTHPPSAHLNTTTQHSLSYWDTIHSDIESHLKKSIPIREPLTVFEPMHYLTFAPPKTSASALCVAACELVGGAREDAIVAASAIHLMHAVIYTHDNLILSDRDAPETVPHRFGSNIELLTGDGIMPFGFELLAGSVGATSTSENVLRVIVEITRAVGVQGMVGGEDRQLHGCGAACGAILGGGSVEEIERLKRYGEFVGKVQGVLSGKGESEGGGMELLQKWRDLALKELEGFDSEKVELISSIVKV